MIGYLIRIIIFLLGPFTIIFIIPSIFYSYFVIRAVLTSLANTPRGLLDTRIAELCDQYGVHYPDYLIEENNEDDEPTIERGPQFEQGVSRVTLLQILWRQLRRAPQTDREWSERIAQRDGKQTPRQSDPVQ